jgi:hypothetical protein
LPSNHRTDQFFFQNSSTSTTLSLLWQLTHIQLCVGMLKLSDFKSLVLIHTTYRCPPTNCWCCLPTLIKKTL